MSFLPSKSYPNAQRFNPERFEQIDHELIVIAREQEFSFDGAKNAAEIVPFIFRKKIVVRASAFRVRIRRIAIEKCVRTVVCADAFVKVESFHMDAL